MSSDANERERLIAHLRLLSEGSPPDARVTVRADRCQAALAEIDELRKHAAQSTDIAALNKLLNRIDELRKTIGEQECTVAEFTGFTNEGDNQSFDMMMLVARELKKVDDECIQRQAAEIERLKHDKGGLISQLGEFQAELAELRRCV